MDKQALKSEYKNTFFLANRDECGKAKGAMWVFFFFTLFTKKDKLFQQHTRFMKCAPTGPAEFTLYSCTFPVIKLKHSLRPSVFKSRSNTGVEQNKAIYFQHSALFSLIETLWDTLALIIFILKLVWLVNLCLSITALIFHLQLMCVWKIPVRGEIRQKISQWQANKSIGLW